MKEEIWKLVTSVFGGIGVIGGFIYWHFKTVNGFKDEIHKIELKCKELENNDKSQQMEIGQLRDLYTFTKDILITKF